MFQPMLDQFRHAIESGAQFQQDLLRNWSQSLSQGVIPAPAGTNGAAGYLERVRAAQKEYAAIVSDQLNRHRELLDTQYRAGIRTFEDALRLGEAKDPEQFRKLIEELWHQGFIALKTLTEVPMRDLQKATEKWIDIATRSLTPASPTPASPTPASA